MGFPNFQLFSPSKQEEEKAPFNLDEAMSSLQHKWTAFLENPSSSSFNPNFFSLAKQAFESQISRFNNVGAAQNPVWARIPANNDRMVSKSLSPEAIEERLAGVPVYALTNSSEEFVLISGTGGGPASKSLGLFCFKKEDADLLLEQMQSMDPAMRRGSRVVAVALNKVVQLKVDGVAFRLIPESAQVKNALREMQRAGKSEEGFSGVPVFQSRSLILKSENKSYRPVFFRKEDLENSLARASGQQSKLNPIYRQGEVQVAVLEEIVHGLKEGSSSEWSDVVFIPPGFDVSTTEPHQ